MAQIWYERKKKVQETRKNRKNARKRNVKRRGDVHILQGNSKELLGVQFDKSLLFNIVFEFLRILRHQLNFTFIFSNKKEKRGREKFENITKKKKTTGLDTFSFLFFEHGNWYFSPSSNIKTLNYE